jgi:hypothetical protein
MSNTANMNLVSPTVGSTSGPTWANNLNSDLSIIDAHDHSPGKGVPITPDGMSITGDLAFNSHNITGARSLRLSAITLGSLAAADVGCLIESGVDLYYVDGNGNQIRITQSGSVAGASGTITGLTSPASAAYSAGSSTFTFQSASNTAAILDAASVIIRKTSASSSGITLTAPVALASNYSLTLPAAPPSSTSILAMDSSGNVTAPAIYPITTAGIAASAGILKSQQAAVGQQVSSSCGTFSTSSGTPVSVTNLSVTLTTTGRPVFIGIQPDGSGQARLTGQMDVYIQRDGSNIGDWLIVGSGASFIPAPMLDVGATAGSHTYVVKVASQIGSISVTNVVLYAYEL